MKLHFRKYTDTGRFGECLQMYLKDDEKIFLITNFELEPYESGKNRFKPVNDFEVGWNGITIDDTELKRMSKEIWSELSDETAYLKGNLEATKNHLKDMQTLVFNKKGK